MGVREEIQKRIEKKQQELKDLEMSFNVQFSAINAYIQALTETLKSLPREGSDVAVQVLRPGSAMAQARDAIQKAGRPLHINEILAAIGKPVDAASRTSVGGSIANYVRRGEIFTRPAPNTFGLLGMTEQRIEEPPEDFGRVRPVAAKPQHGQAKQVPPEDDDDVPF